MRARGLAEREVPEAVRVYGGGLTLQEVGFLFGVSQGVVRRASASADLCRSAPRGRRGVQAVDRDHLL